MKLKTTDISISVVEAAVCEAERFWCGHGLGTWKRERAIKAIVVALVMSIEIPLPPWVRKLIHPVLRQWIKQKLVDNADQLIGQLVDAAAARLYPKQVKGRSKE